jgi:hypothetical protein
MKMFQHTPRILALAAAVAAIPATAHAADQIGAAGYIDTMEVNTASADAYLQFHGRLFVAVNKQSTTEYRWGGTSCGTKTLTEHQVMVLTHALDNGLKIVPRWQNGQGRAVPSAW